MHIVELQAENLKKLRAVTIRPDGNLVEITGRNGQGKTSVLDAIWWALAGAKHIQAQPIREGADEAFIRLDLGEVKVTRRFRRGEEGKITTSLLVEREDGSQFRKPQEMLDGLLSALSIDPLGFMRLDGRGQFNTLRQFVPDVDFDMIDELNRQDFQERTDVNRRAKEARTRADGIRVPDNVPEPVDDAALIEQLHEAAEHNAGIERRKARRDDVANNVGICRRGVEKNWTEIGRLRAEADRLEEQANAWAVEADADQARLNAAEALPDPIDTVAVCEAIAASRQTNEAAAAGARARADRETLLAQAKAASEEADALTAAMEQREREKAEAIAAARMPVAGISFGAGCVLLNGLPLDQASSAEQLRASVGIAMAMNPKLRVIRVQDGSLLDEASMQILAAMAEETDCQVWVERVDSSGRIGFVIEDGEVAARPLLQAAE